jgi:hypothetical protein
MPGEIGRKYLSSVSVTRLPLAREHANTRAHEGPPTRHGDTAQGVVDGKEVAHAGMGNRHRD